MEYQVQINSIKAKLQETRARKKQQEELIMKVENQALKVSSAHINTPCYTPSFRTHEQGHAGVFMWWKCLQLHNKCFSNSLLMWRNGESGCEGARVKPWQLIEAQLVEWNQPCFCYSSLAEPLPGFVGWDYSARGAGDGAGKNPFTEKREWMKGASFWEFLLFSWLGCHITCALSFTSPDGKFQMQSCSNLSVSGGEWNRFIAMA